MAPLTPGAGHLNDLRGDFGEAWVETLAMAAGLEPYVSKRDSRKTDLVFQADDGELVRIQVKATEAPGSNADGYTRSVSMDTYDRLRTGSSRGFVVLVVVHQPHPGWVAPTPNFSAVRATAYIAELTGAAEVHDQDSVTVSFPPSTMLTHQWFVANLAVEGGADVGA